MLSNREVAKVLNDIAVYLAMDKVPFKPRAYEKAAATIASLEKPVAEIWEEGGVPALKEIPGVGESIASKIEELLEHGHLKFYERIMRKVPAGVIALTAIEGMGPS